MATMHTEQTMVYIPHENKTCAENLDRIFGNIRQMLENDNNFRITMHMPNTQEMDPVEMSDLIANADRMIKRIDKSPELTMLLHGGKDEEDSDN